MPRHHVRVRSVALSLVLGGVLLCVGGGSALGSGSNLIPNPTFQSGSSYSFSGWGLTNATTQSVSPGEDDSFATLVQPSGTPTTYGIFVKPQPVGSAAVGSQYQGSAWVQSGTTGKNVCVNLRDVTSGGSLAQPLVKSCVTTPTAGWMQVTTPTMTVVNSGDTVGFTVTQGSVASTDSFEVDNTSLLQVEGSTDTTAPSVPTGLQATQTSSSVSLSWTASTDTDDNSSLLTYQVSRDGTVVGTTGAGVTSYTDTGLSAGTQYTYTVQAFDPAGNGSPTSDPFPVTTSQDTTAPTAPTGVTATANGSSITVAWKASTDSDDSSSSLTYAVYQYTNLIATVPGTSSPLNFTDNSLQSGTSASYYVVARDPAGNQSASSTTVWATTASAATTVADWEMDEHTGSTTMLDSSGNNINGTLTNAKAGQPGVNGTAYSFTPKAYVTVPDNALLDPGNRDISITLHFKTSSLPSSGDYDLLRKGKSPGGSEYKIELLGSGQILCSFHGSNGVGVQSSGSSLANGAWHTITCARTDWRTASLTVDGTPYTHTNGAIGPVSPTQKLYLGANPDAGNDYYKGSLDDITIQVG